MSHKCDSCHRIPCVCCPMCEYTPSDNVRHLVSMYRGMTQALEVVEQCMDRAKSEDAQFRLWVLYEGITLWQAAKRHTC